MFYILTCKKQGRDVIYKIESGLSGCLKEFLRGERVFLYKNWRLEDVHDRVSGDRTHIGEIPGVKNKCRYLWGLWGFL